MCALFSEYVTNLNRALTAITHHTAEMWRDIDEIAANNKNILTNLQLCRETKTISKPSEQTLPIDDDHQESVVDVPSDCADNNEQCAPTRIMVKSKKYSERPVEYDILKEESLVSSESCKSRK